VLDITGNGALDVFIGLAFFFFVFSVVCSVINEAVATVLNLRAKTLRDGIRNLLNDPTEAETYLETFYGKARIQALFKPTRFFGRDQKPSYISPRAFALAFLDTVAPSSDAVPSKDLIGRANAAVGTLADSPVRTLLQDALDEAGTYRAGFQAALERSFNEAMDRVSGWYKRKVQLFLFVIALVVVALFNADSFQIGKTLWQNGAVRAAVVAQATGTVKKGAASVCGTSKSAGSKSAQSSDTPVQKAVTCVTHVKQLGFPIGWSGAPSIRNWGAFFAKILGLLITAIAVLLGAPFWFDTLSKLAQLRGTGAAPGDKNSNTSKSSA
jgi:hypothetical protein